MINMICHPSYKECSSVNRQQGFTLIEISVVLVIIGLLIGGVMQGQSLIRAAKVRDIIITATDLSASAAAFKQRYHMLPGDHPTATAEIQGAVGNGNGNGLISAAESSNVPNHLFTSGFIKGGAVAPITTVYGSVWLVQQSVAITGGSPCGTAVTASAPPVNNVIVFSNLSGEAAGEIDTKMDDGVFSTGSIRGSIDYSNDSVQCLAMPL